MTLGFGRDPSGRSRATRPGLARSAPPSYYRSTPGDQAAGDRLPEITGGKAPGLPDPSSRRPTRYDLHMAGQKAPVSDNSDRSVLVIQVNGEPQRVPPGCSVEQLLLLLEVSDRRVAVAVNRNIVARSHYASSKLSSGDRIEILEAVGGG